MGWIIFLDVAIKIDPNYSSALSNKGIALDDLGKYDEAIESYDKALELDPFLGEKYKCENGILDLLGMAFCVITTIRYTLEQSVIQRRRIA
jgi:tetratricopeptide (TPR) repeat protein